jgi:hypothetical protein
VTLELRPAQYLEFRVAADELLRAHTGAEALRLIDLVDMVSVAGGCALLPAGYAFLEMQGAGVAVSNTLSVIALADPDLLDLAQLDPARTVVASLLQDDGASGRAAVLGASAGSRVVIDVPGSGLIEIPAEPRSLAVSGATVGEEYVDTIWVDLEGCTTVVAEDKFAPFRAQLLARARIGAAAEILGACCRLLDDATEYARARSQFGQAIGSYQAIQHSLAWAATDLHQLTMLIDHGVEQAATATIDPMLASVTKALAGSVSRRISQITLQVTGAMGFTWEYSHNQLNRRCMILDQVFGSAQSLTAAVGRQVRTTKSAPGLISLQKIPVRSAATT